MFFRDARFKSYIKAQLALISSLPSEHITLLNYLAREYYNALLPGSVINPKDSYTHYTDLVYLSLLQPFGLLEVFNELLDAQTVSTVSAYTSPLWYKRFLGFMSLQNETFGHNGYTCPVDPYDSDGDLQLASTASLRFIKSFASILFKTAKMVDMNPDTSWSIYISDDLILSNSLSIKVVRHGDESRKYIFDYLSITSNNDVVALAFDGSQL